MNTELIETEEVVHQALVVSGPANTPISFDVALADIEQMKTKALSLTIMGPEDKSGYEEVFKLRQVVKRQRVTVEKTGKEMKAPHLQYNREVDAAMKDLVGPMESIEDGLSHKEKAYTDERERIAEERAAAIRERYQKRTLVLKDMGFVFDDVNEAYHLGDYYINKDDIRDQSDEDYEPNLFGAEMAYRLEQDRLADIKLKEQQEAERVAEQERVEREKLAEERRQFNQQQAELKRQQDEIQQKERELEAERKRIDDANIAEFARQQQEQERIEWERQEAEREKVEAATEKQKRKDDRERQKRLSPDKKAIGQFMTRLLNTQPWPEMAQVETVDFQADFYEQLRAFVDGYKTKLTEL